jgi:hypothetical protein
MSNRRTFLKSAALGAPAMMLSSDGLLAQAGASEKSAVATMEIKALKPPANGPINVAFVISKGADVLDIGGLLGGVRRGNADCQRKAMA